MNRTVAMMLLCVAGAVCAAQKPAGEAKVPSAPASTEQEKLFRDKQFDVRFRVPPGWDLTKKDGELSTFHIDARSAPAGTMLRGVAMMHFNPYPRSTLAGAMFYYSVEPHANDAECAQQASAKLHSGRQEERTTQDIAGMSFAHGHDEYGDICVESRDEIYTAYRKGACYRFDLTLNTFCSVSSGVREISRKEMLDVEQRLADILSTVELGWEKSGPHPVPVPEPQGPEPPRAPMKPGQ